MDGTLSTDRGGELEGTLSTDGGEELEGTLSTDGGEELEATLSTDGGGWLQGTLLTDEGEGSGAFLVFAMLFNLGSDADRFNEVDSVCDSIGSSEVTVGVSIGLISIASIVSVVGTDISV